MGKEEIANYEQLLLLPQRTKSCTAVIRAANCRKIAHLTPSCNHPQNFIAMASRVLEICTGQNSSMEKQKTKGNNLEN